MLKKGQKLQKNTGSVYPFGLKHKGYNSNIVSEHDWKFQGQELEESLGLNVYEFELRQYDPAIGRFMTTDPYEQFDSPYIAMGNNPVVSFDPDGGFCYDANGNQIACPEGEFFDDVRDSETNHYNELKEVVIESSKKENDSESGDDGNEESNEDTDNKISYTYTLTKPEGPIGGPGFIEFIGPGGLFKWKSLQQLLKTFTSKGGTKWIFGAFKTEAKWASQLAKRGWTQKQITEAISKGQQFKAVNNVNKANSATRYVHPATGKSVVIDDVTKELLHVGGPGFKY